MPRPQSRGRDDGFGEGGRAELHFDGELLLNHPVAQPIGEVSARLRGGQMLQPRRRLDGAEVGGDPRKELLLVAIGRKGKPVRTAQIAGDDFGVCFVQQEAGAIEKLHERAGPRQPALGKEREPAVAREELGHALDRVRRVGVNGKGPAVDHDLAVDPARLSGRAGYDVLPILVHADVQEQPVQPRDMVGHEQHGAGRVQHFRVVGPETPKQPDEPSENSPHHGREDLSVAVCAARQ